MFSEGIIQSETFHTVKVKQDSSWILLYFIISVSIYMLSSLWHTKQCSSQYHTVCATILMSSNSAGIVFNLTFYLTWLKYLIVV